MEILNKLYNGLIYLNGFLIILKIIYSRKLFTLVLIMKWKADFKSRIRQKITCSVHKNVHCIEHS